MPTTIPADLTLVLRRQLVNEYVNATEEAMHAAQGYLSPDEGADTRELGATLCAKRTVVLDLEAMFELLADDLVKGDDTEVPDDRRVRVYLAGLIEDAIRDAAYMDGEYMDEKNRPNIHLIVTTGRLLERLQALCDEIEHEAVTAY